MSQLDFYIGEIKALRWEVKDDTNEPVDLTNATPTLVVTTAAGEGLFTKSADDFDVTDAEDGILTVLTSALNTAGTYNVVLKLTWAVTGLIDKAVDVMVVEDTGE